MPTFSYTAIEAKTGRERKGTIDEGSVAQATVKLKSRGLAPTALAPALLSTATSPRKSTEASPRRSLFAGTKTVPAKRKWRSMTIGRVVSVKNLTRFTRQLSTLVRAGMPLMRGLEVLWRQEKNAAFADIISDLAETIRSGGTFSDGLQRHSRIFDPLFINMVKAGEAGGVLDTLLDRLSRFMEKAEHVRGKVRAALTYPTIVLALAVGIVAALMVFVVPRFEQIFSGLLRGQPLPALTQAVLGVSYFVQHHVVVSLGLIAGGAAGFLAFRKTFFGQRVLDGLALRVPVLGDLVLKAATARFTRTFGTLLSSGVPILQALIITRDTCGNVHLASAIETVHDRVKAGDNVARPLAATGIFPGMVTSMIEVGEETGALAEMLERIADNYDDEVDNAVAGLTSIIEPIMIVFLALVVGTIVIALFIPIISIIQHLQ